MLMGAAILGSHRCRTERTMVRRERHLASPQQPLRARHPAPDLSRGRFSEPAVRTISSCDGDCGCRVDRRHFPARWNFRTGPVELAQAMEYRRLGCPAVGRCLGDLDSCIGQVRSKKLSPAPQCRAGSLDALGVLARVVVLLSGWRELPPPGAQI